MVIKASLLFSCAGFCYNEAMKDFPKSMKNKKNLIDASQQNTKDIEGYYFENKDGRSIHVFGGRRIK